MKQCKLDLAGHLCVHVHVWVGTPDCIYNTTVVAHITQRATVWGVVHTLYTTNTHCLTIPEIPLLLLLLCFCPLHREVLRDYNLVCTDLVELLESMPVKHTI